MSKAITLLKAMIDEDKITIQEVLETCGYEVNIVQDDIYETKYKPVFHESDVLMPCDILIGYDEKIVATKKFR